MTDPRTLRVVIVDDEPMGRTTLRSLLECEADIELIAECRDGDEALATLRNERPDLVFLDVQMPGRTGFDVVRELTEEERPRIVFVTAFDHYALEAFEVHAIDYLLKPFHDERFHQTLERVRAEFRRDAVEGMGRRLANLVGGLEAEDAPTPSAPSDPREGQAPPEPPPAGRIAIHREGRLDLIEVDSVVWIEAADQYVRLHTEDGVHLMRESMGHFERTLDASRFLRVHRSAIVDLQRVRTLETRPGGTGRLLVGDDTWIPVSRSRIPTVRERLG